MVTRSRKFTAFIFWGSFFFYLNLVTDVFAYTYGPPIQRSQTFFRRKSNFILRGESNIKVSSVGKRGSFQELRDQNNVILNSDFSEPSFIADLNEEVLNEVDNQIEILSNDFFSFHSFYSHSSYYSFYSPY